MTGEQIKNAIIQKLIETKERHHVKIPLVVESGSRGWGFASPDSDYDCRFVYVREMDWYLSVFDKTDVIEYAAGQVYDINGWDLKKFIAHVVKSNAVMLEWLSSTEVYLNDASITSILVKLGKEFFNPITISHHYLSIAVKKYAEINSSEKSKLKHYFYVLRPLANISYIEKYGKMPYMEYFRTVGEIDLDENVMVEISRIWKVKEISDEGYTMTRNETLLRYFADEIKRQDKRLPNVRFEKNRDYEYADVVFRTIIEMTWRNA